MMTRREAIATLGAVVVATRAWASDETTLKGDMIETIIFGTLLGIPMALLGWFGPGRWWARRVFVTVPEQLAAKQEQAKGGPGDGRTGGQEDGRLRYNVAGTGKKGGSSSAADRKLVLWHLSRSSGSGIPSSSDGSLG